MHLVQYGECTNYILFKVYNEKVLLGWVHYIKAEDSCRYTVSGPIGTHEKVQRLVMSWIVDRILLGS